MSVELNAATIEYLGDTFTLLDCPGSVEFMHDGMAALSGCDAAVVVCEADEKKLFALQMVMKSLEATGIPHLLFKFIPGCSISIGNKTFKFDGISIGC